MGIGEVKRVVAEKNPQNRGKRAKGEMWPLEQTLSSLVETLSSMAGNLHNTTTEINAVADQIKSISDEMSAIMEEMQFLERKVKPNENVPASSQNN
jgi:hypothetical protein